jgi:hypothetical protein
MRALTKDEARERALPGRSPIWPWEEIEWYEPETDAIVPSSKAIYKLVQMLLGGNP